MAAARGFTLMETVVVLLILATASAVVVASVSDTNIAAMRRASSELAGTIRAVYDDAVLTGQTYRLVFDFKSSTIKSEATQKVLSFAKGSNALVQASKLKPQISTFLSMKVDAPADDDSDSDSASSDTDSDAQPNPLAALFKIGQLAAPPAGSGGSAFHPGRSLKLPDGVKVQDVWIEGMDKPEDENTVYLYFFPHGSTQEAIIHLKDDDNIQFSVRVRPLTGECKIENKYMVVPK